MPWVRQVPVWKVFLSWKVESEPVLEMIFVSLHNIYFQPWLLQKMTEHQLICRGVNVPYRLRIGTRVVFPKPAKVFSAHPPSCHKEICYDGLEESCWGNLREVDFFSLSPQSEGFLVSFTSAELHPSSPFDFQQKEGIPHKRWRSIDMVDSSLLLWTLTGHLRDGLSQAT